MFIAFRESAFVDFKDIVDYVALMSLFLKILGILKTERKIFVASVLEAFNDYDTKIAENKIKAVILRRGVIARLKQIYNNTLLKNVLKIYNIIDWGAGNTAFEEGNDASLFYLTFLAQS